LIGTASVAELTGPEIKELLSGKSRYVAFTGTSIGGADVGVIYYAIDGSPLYWTAPGPMWRGKWTIMDNTSCADWKESPDNQCSKWGKQGDVVTSDQFGHKSDSRQACEVRSRKSGEARSIGWHGN
jgi:hypothetical protein